MSAYEDLKNTFNAVADDKVVSFKEWKAATKAKYKSELTFGEKLFLNTVDKPKSAWAGLKVAAAIAKGTISADGFTKDPRGTDKFMSGKAYKAMVTFMLRDAASSAFQKKINTLATEAFQQCPDVSDTPAYQRAVPLFRR